MTDIYRAHIQDHGRVVIPAAMRQALHFNIGDEVFFHTDENRVVITHVNHALSQFRHAVAEHFPQDRDLVGELLEERRAEATRHD